MCGARDAGVGRSVGALGVCSFFRGVAVNVAVMGDAGAVDAVMGLRCRQGLFFHNGFLYESTGLYGHSSLRKVRVDTGEVVQKVDLEDNLFGASVLAPRAASVVVPVASLLQPSAMRRVAAWGDRRGYHESRQQHLHAHVARAHGPRV